jgi:pimeloyl-ACP methyl ester carboxylesterase
MKPNRRNVMTKLYAAAALVATLMGATLNAAAAGPAPTGIKNVVLVHGAFADGSGWEAVAKILEKDGYTVSVAQPPETSYADDQKSTRAAIDAMGGPVVLVGHSYGGSIISEAGNDPNVAGVQRQVAVLGYCLGGLMVFLTAVRCHGVDTAVAYHGGDTEKYLAEVGGLNAPLLMHLAEEDEFISKAAQAEIKAALAKRPNATVYSYPGQNHAFSRHNGAHYNAAAAALANGRTSEFLHQQLR